MRTPAHQQSRKLSVGSVADLREQCHISHSQDYLHLPKNGMPSVPNALPNSYPIDPGQDHWRGSRHRIQPNEFHNHPVFMDRGLANPMQL